MGTYEKMGQKRTEKMMDDMIDGQLVRVISRCLVWTEAIVDTYLCMNQNRG